VALPKPIMDFAAASQRQRAFFQTAATRSVKFRRAQLGRLAGALERHKTRLLAALHADLRKSPMQKATPRKSAWCRRRFVTRKNISLAGPRPIAAARPGLSRLRAAGCKPSRLAWRSSSALGITRCNCSSAPSRRATWPDVPFRYPPQTLAHAGLKRAMRFLLSD
jgi:hypothetical protein